MMKGMKAMKPKKGVVPAGYADGGKVKQEKAMGKPAAKKPFPPKQMANGGMAKKGKC